MPRNARKLALFLFPIACFIFTLGWVLSYFGSKAKLSVAKPDGAEFKVAENVHFGVLTPEEQLAGAPVVQVRGDAAKQVKPRFHWLRDLV